MSDLRKAVQQLLPWALALAGLLLGAQPAQAEEPPEYRLKTAIIYSFALYTDWPDQVGPTIKLCLLGQDSFGGEINALQGQAVGSRKLIVQRQSVKESLADCQMVYISPAAMAALPRILETLGTRPVLTLADSPDAALQGVALNMILRQARVDFEVNIKAAREAGLNFSSKLLRLAKEIHQ